MITGQEVTAKWTENDVERKGIPKAGKTPKAKISTTKVGKGGDSPGKGAYQLQKEESRANASGSVKSGAESTKHATEETKKAATTFTKAAEKTTTGTKGSTTTTTTKKK